MLQRALHLAVVVADRPEFRVAHVEPPDREFLPWKPAHQEIYARHPHPFRTHNDDRTSRA